MWSVKHVSRTAGFIAAVCAAHLLGAFAVSAADFTVPAAPFGVTFQLNFKSLPGAGGGGDGQTLTYASDTGRALYMSDKDSAGQSACTGACAAAWPPFTASAQSKPVGAWSFITRDDGTRQWAFRGRALYFFAGDERPGDMKGAGTAEGWHLASLDPANGIVFPSDVAARELPDAQGQGLVSHQSLTLYIFEGDVGGKSACAGECTALWRPYTAAAMAHAVGDFSVILRPDGIRQWAYKGQPLYTNANDEEPGDTRGRDSDPRWQVALITRYYMPDNVAIINTDRHGAIMALNGRRALYAQDIVRFTGGGIPHANRLIARGLPVYGRMIGIACTGKCTETHEPFLAPAGAQANGYWSVVTRPDGTRQWAYMDFPLYVFSGDMRPGEVRSHDVADINATVANNNEPAFTAAPVGIYWRVALP